MDIDTEKDAHLFIDPLLLSADYEAIVVDFLATAYDLYYQKNQKDYALGLFIHSKECDAIHLGYSSSKSKGKGVSKEMLDQYFGYVSRAIDSLQERLLTPIAMPVFVKRFSKDRMSDLLASILKKKLLEYSLEQAKIHGLKISDEVVSFDYWDIENHQWSTFESRYVVVQNNDKNDDELLILVPKTIVSQSFVVTPARYISAIFDRLQTMSKYKRPNGKVLTKKELRKREITDKYVTDKDKEYILNKTMENPDWFERYYDHSVKFNDNKSLSDDVLIKYLKK